MAGTITALRFQKRNTERVNVYLDGRFALALPATVAATLNRGQHLSDEAIARLRAADEEQKAYERALRFLAYRPRSQAEVRLNLQKHDVPDLVIEAVIGRLQDRGYLDEEAFARFWVSDRERFKPKGPIALRQELRQKGISEQIISQVLRSVDSESSAYRAALAKGRRLSGMEKKSFSQKLGSYLLRRGFGHDVVWSVVDQVWRELHAQHADSE